MVSGREEGMQEGKLILIRKEEVKLYIFTGDMIAQVILKIPPNFCVEITYTVIIKKN